MSSLLYLLDHKNLFKSEIVQNRARRMNIKAVELLCEMLRWCQVRGIDPVVTETVTTIGEDNALKRVSSTHREGRAFDIRTRGWIKKDIEDFMAHFNDKHWSLGAISAKTGKPNLIVHHDAGTGPHFHVQLAKKYALPNPLQLLASDKEVIEANQAAVTPIAALKEEFEKRLKTAVAKIVAEWIEAFAKENSIELPQYKLVSNQDVLHAFAQSYTTEGNEKKVLDSEVGITMTKILFGEVQP